MSLRQPEREGGLIEVNIGKAEALNKRFRDTLDLIHEILSDIPRDRKGAVEHAKRLKGYGEDSMLPKDLALLGQQVLNLFKFSLMTPSGFHLQLQLTPTRAYEKDLGESIYSEKRVGIDSVTHFLSVGRIYQENDTAKQLALDIEVPNDDIPHLILREIVNDSKGKDRIIKLDDLLGIKAVFQKMPPYQARTE